MIKETQEKYDLSYKREVETGQIGIILLAGYFLMLTDPGINFKMFLVFYTIPLRLICFIACYKISQRQNRDEIVNACIGLVFPLIMLIVLGYSKKFNSKNHGKTIEITNERSEKKYSVSKF